MNTSNQALAERAREIRREIHEEEARRLGSLTLRQQLGKAEAARRDENQARLDPATEAALKRAEDADTYQGLELIDMRGYRNLLKRDAVPFEEEEPGWPLLDYTHREGAGTTRDQFYMLVKGVYCKVTTLSGIGSKTYRNTHIVPSSNVATLPQPEFETLMQTLASIDNQQPSAVPNAEQ